MQLCGKMQKKKANELQKLGKRDSHSSENSAN